MVQQNSSQIIIALDGISNKKAVQIAKKLKGLIWGFKVNDLLFEDHRIIKKLKKYGKVFADAKLHDIPNTVANSAAKLSGAGADMITVHSSGGVEMMRTAKKSAGKSKILAVTLLTSRENRDINIFNQLIADSIKANVDGIVCSGSDLKNLKRFNKIKVVPGVRPVWYNKKDDQKRVVTPREALRSGANYIVIGRPVTNSKDLMGAINKILKEIL